MNLCIQSNETRSLGIDRHVCELQLSLKSIACLTVRSRLVACFLSLALHEKSG